MPYSLNNLDCKSEQRIGLLHGAFLVGCNRPAPKNCLADQWNGGTNSVRMYEPSQAIIDAHVDIPQARQTTTQSTDSR